MEAYRRMYEIHLRECNAARGEGLRVACFAGVHPAEVDRMIDKYRQPPEKALETALGAVEVLRRLCREGAIEGVGEVGRQHYKTSPLRVAIAMAVMEEAVAAALEEGCLVQLHLENEGPATVETVDRILRRAGATGARRGMVIFHHATLRVAREAVARGYNATIPGVPKLLEHAIAREPPHYLVESDYLDDPARPGAVVEPWLLARKLREVASTSLEAEEWVRKASIDLVEKVFHTRPP
ncbi:TatD family hydrolase [Aeropyrum camini]|uniref:TatD family hydrolase n=1 Tax=Aeropyrum camini TaxID=229980 RepID=UPI0007895F96|nr:TatD family hydrolase [Aeropyrum camini]